LEPPQRPTARAIDPVEWEMIRADAQGYLASLIGELLDAPHGYLLPFDHLVSALAGKAPGRQYGTEVTPALGYGPIDRLDGLAAPADPGAIARRRLAPLVTRMRGDHSLGGES
jgi:hypothetical protein